MKILVTGGAGFIGSHLVDGLVDAGHNVAILDNFSTGSQRHVNPRAIVFKADVTVRESVATVIQSFAPEVVYHYAAQVSVPISFQNPIEDCEANVMGMLNLLMAFRAMSTKPRFIFASSGGAVYGDATEFPSMESTPPNPATPYGVSKLACEQYLSVLSESEGLKTVVLRFSNVFGPRQGTSKETGVCAVFLKQACTGAHLTIFGDGSQTRDYVYVSDLTRAGILCLERGTGETLNLCSGIETSTLELATVIQSISDPRPEIEFLPDRPGDVRRSWLARDLARNILGWQPEISLREGLVKAYAEQRERFATSG